ncbi:MAG: tyrosine-type recombinase/integrase [Aliishimia sp.]
MWSASPDDSIRLGGQKLPLKPKHVWAIRVRLELAENHRGLALFNLTNDSKLRGRDYARIVRDWAGAIGLETTVYNTHSARRTKVTQIYKKAGNLRAVQLLLGHTKMDSTGRYLGVELEDAMAFSEAIEI